ncbi:polysaccharide pyruvyl transferase family protein [Ruegeria sp. HU-ET01832]|uniref:polysaccharide pyruvyl transferase family protein n=1 Tax=Ruegeria sp. HU-ET01832 TaxID=3135906 RepID=UPI00310BF99B
MKIVLAAVMHSPNLGDGLIADCLTTELRRQNEGLYMCWLDLAGRQTFAKPPKGARTLLLSLLNRLPQGISQHLATRLVRRQIRKRLEPLIPDRFGDATAVVIGGGQLLSDANLNFPFKISRVVHEAERRDLPIALHSVGVAKTWSPRGLAVFADLLSSTKLCFVSVRDQGSADNLRQHYETLGLNTPEIHVVPDPALIAGNLDLPPPPADVAGTIGLGVAHPAAIKTHTDQDALGFRQSLSQYQSILAEFQTRQEPVTLFTNGAGEDEEMLEQLWTSLSSKQNLFRMPRPQKPRELVTAIKAMDTVVSHRLHACITAHAVETPAIGFRWDAKLDGYFARVGGISSAPLILCTP